MTYVALTRACTISPIVAFLKRIGVSADKSLAKAELPPWIMAEEEALIPATSPAGLFRAVLRDEDIPNLGLTAGEQAPIDALGIFGRLIRSAPTLGAALKSAVRYSSKITSNRPLWLRPRGDRVELCMSVAARFDPRDVAWQQDNHFCLGLMVGVVRLAAGPSWRPAEVHLQTDEAAGLRDAESLASARVAFRQPETMVAIPRALLATRLPPFPATEIPTAAVEQWKSCAPARDFAGSIRQAVETLSRGEDYPSVRQTADFVGLSVRALQRRLAAAGVSHEVLVAQTRFATAAAVLEQANAKIRILDLALDLGYSDHANFTRAFRRWAGCSPQEYRVTHARRRGVAKSQPPSGGKAGSPPDRSDVGRREGIALATWRAGSSTARPSAATCTCAPRSSTASTIDDGSRARVLQRAGLHDRAEIDGERTGWARGVGNACREDSEPGRVRTPPQDVRGREDGRGQRGPTLRREKVRDEGHGGPEETTRSPHDEDRGTERDRAEDEHADHDRARPVTAPHGCVQTQRCIP